MRGHHIIADPHRIYQAHDQDTLLSEVTSVQCVLLPRAVLAAGFGGDGKVLLIRYSSYGKDHPEWQVDFFEHEFINEPLLGVPQLVKNLFAASMQQLLVPDELYDETEARTWLHALYPMPPDEWIQDYPCAADGATYLFSLPGVMHRLLHRYFGPLPLLPLPAYQFYRPASTMGYRIQCAITADLVLATLRNGGKLLWHGVFPYENVEDIAFHLAHLCRQQHIVTGELPIECTTLCDTCYDLAPNLQTYFPKLTWTNDATGDEAGYWTPVVYLLQQCYACAL